MHIHPSLAVTRSTLEKKPPLLSLSHRLLGPVQADHLISLRTVVTAAASAHACHFRVISPVRVLNVDLSNQLALDTIMLAAYVPHNW